MHFEQSYYVSVIKRHFPESFVDTSVLEVGSYDVNGTIREFFENCEYTGLDLMPGPGVDVVSSGHEYKTYKRFDTVVSCECFEHNPYFFETFENMVASTCGGGLIIFSCATEGRPEHGTSRTSPDQSPGTISSGWDYYRNLTEKDFAGFDFQRNFAGYRFMVNPGSQDLYFVGVKYPEPKGFEERLNSIAEEVAELVDGSLKIAKFEALLQEKDATGAEAYLDGFVSSLSPTLEAHARYKQAWLLISSKRYQQAEIVLNRIFTLCLNSMLGARPEYHYQHSQYLHETGKPDAAMAAARGAIEKAPFYAEYWEHLARLMLNAGDTQGAENALLEASRLSSLDAALQSRINEINFRKKIASGNGLSKYDIATASLSSADFDSRIKKWNLDSPIDGILEAMGEGELAVSGWAMPGNSQDEIRVLVKIGSTVEACEMNVDRPDVVAANPQLLSGGRTQARCGFSISVPVKTPVFTLGFRVAGVDCWAREVRVSKRPPLLAGKDQWEFASGTGNGILELNDQPASFERQNVTAWNKRIAGENEKLKTPHLVLVAPHKAAVYPDMLPADTALAFNRPVYEILSRNFTVAYPLERLLTARVRRPTYYRTGAVWSSYGAYMAYRVLMDKLDHVGLNKKLVEESAVVWGADGSMKSFERKAQLSFQNGLIGPGQIKQYKNSAGAGMPRVVVFCDEFGMTDFDSFLAESCSELLCIHLTELDAELVERFAPDVVLSQYSEEVLAQASAESGSLFGVIKTGFNNGIYPAAQLEQLVSSGWVLNDILGEKDASVLLHEAQNILR